MNDEWGAALEKLPIAKKADCGTMLIEHFTVEVIP
jgi:hypothetical protein